ncbi:MULTISPECIES: CstA-like transporter-associated (seleno)protein [Streptomyces]|uniref:CstA-like transporter-associated (Seleno)protein n=2 Tax=Streptomyces TaxID=1883 RepID=A0ABV9IUE0_9ACTN
MTALRRVLATVLWYAREVTGEAEYDRYRTRHPHVSRREYQRMRTARSECASPGRCC